MPYDDIRPLLVITCCKPGELGLFRVVFEDIVQIPTKSKGMFR